MIDRYITTDISASIVGALRVQGWTCEQMAKRIDAPLSFIRGVQAKTQVLTMKDIEALARGTGQTAELMVLDAMGKKVKPELRELVTALRNVLELSASIGAEPGRRGTKKRRTRTKAA